MTTHSLNSQSERKQRFFRFTYLRPYSAGLPHIHELRDGDAFIELGVDLAASGYEYGGLLLNHQGGVDLSVGAIGIQPSDIVVLTTRPPLADDPELHRLFIQRTKTELEELIFGSMRRFFKRCSRARVILTDEFAESYGKRIVEI